MDAWAIQTLISACIAIVSMLIPAWVFVGRTSTRLENIEKQMFDKDGNIKLLSLEALEKMQEVEHRDIHIHLTYQSEKITELNNSVKQIYDILREKR